MSHPPLDERGAKELREFLGFDKPSTEAGPLEEGRRLGRYRVGALLGRGGMGAVYRAVDEELHREVALKVLTATTAASAQERFEREARAAARLDHPNIVRTFDVGEAGGLRYLVMELVEGTPLADLPPARGAADLAARLKLIARIARAIDHAHQHGVIHRDLKPANVLVDRDGNPHVADFGLARVTGEDLALTRASAAIGTPTYMSPEQVRGDGTAIDARTDIYSIGVMLYEAVTGLPPYRGMTSLEVYTKILRGDVAPPRRLNPGLSADVETICLKAMNLEPPGRYPTAAAFAEDLERHLRDEPILARPLSLPGRALKWVRRNAALSAALLVAASGLLGGAAFGAVQLIRAAESERARRREVEERLEGERASRRIVDLIVRVQDAQKARDHLIDDLPAHRRSLEALVADLDAALAKQPGSAAGHYAKGLALIMLDRDAAAEPEFGAAIARAGSETAGEAISSRIERARILLRRLLDYRQPFHPREVLTLMETSKELQARAEEDLEAVKRAGSAAGEALRLAEVLGACVRFRYVWVAFVCSPLREDMSKLDGDRRAVLKRCEEAIARGGRIHEYLLMAAEVQELEGYQAELTDPFRGDAGLRAYEKALVHADQAARMAPNWAEAFRVRARIRAKIGGELRFLQRPDRAAEFYELATADLARCIECSPGCGGAYYLRANIRSLTGRPGEAIPDYTRSLELDPANLHALRRRGSAKLASGDPAGAVKDLEELARRVPDLAEEIAASLAEARRRAAAEEH